MRQQSLDFFKELLTTPSPSGHESAGQRIWCAYARQFADEVRTDAYGNAVAVLNPGGDPKLMLDGHVDEIGLMVKHIDEKGFIYVQRIGGVDPALVRGKRVDVHTDKGIVRGVIGAPAIHLQERGKEPKPPKLHESFIDIGAADGKAAKKRVSIGDPITFVDDFEQLDGNVAVARGFDDRAGTWAVVEALRIAAAAKTKPSCAIYACSSIQEEVGLIGAGMNVFNVKPDAAIAVDVTHATDTPGIDAKQHGEIKLGKGPSLSIGRENHPLIVERLRKLAKRKRIPVQFEAFSTTGGTDAMAIYKAQGGVPSALLSIPNRYMHTTVEMLDLRDLQRSAELLAAFAVDLKKGERFAVKV
jgi:putative aminopeptidase FrvX